MEAVMVESGIMEEQSSFGIKKIVDCKVGEGGQQMYKVKWQATWEPAENLVTCQHLIDEFWSFVNKAKAKEEVAKQHRKRMHLERGMNNITNIDQNFNRLTDDNKAEVQRLITRTNATSVGNQMLMSPSNMLMASPQHNQQNKLMDMAQTPTHANNQNFPNSPQTPQNIRQQNPPMSSSGQKSLNFGSTQQHNSLGAGGDGQQKGNAPMGPAKVEADNSDKTTGESAANSKISNQASLKYLESFTNPYVKVIIVCKICNKEASKFSRNWKPHYLTHVSSEEKPHQCPLCPAGFVSLTALRKHEEKKHPNEFACKSEYLVKGEAY